VTAAAARGVQDGNNCLCYRVRARPRRVLL